MLQSWENAKFGCEIAKRWLGPASSVPQVQALRVSVYRCQLASGATAVGLRMRRAGGQSHCPQCRRWQPRHRPSCACCTCRGSPLEECGFLTAESLSHFIKEKGPISTGVGCWRRLWFDEDGVRDTVILSPGLFCTKVIGAVFRPAGPGFAVPSTHRDGAGPAPWAGIKTTSKQFCSARSGSSRTA